jgi:hypothetical protein
VNGFQEQEPTEEDRKRDPELDVGENAREPAARPFLFILARVLGGRSHMSGDLKIKDSRDREKRGRIVPRN